MKLLTFVDLHGNLNALKKLESISKKQKPDVVICAGDFTLFEDHIEQLVKRISKLGKKVLMLHGNHETGVIVRKLCSFYKNMHFIHRKMFMINDYLFVGFGGGGFETVDKGFEKYARQIKNKIKNKKIILITHSPPYKTKLDLLGKEHCGNKTITEFIRKNNVKLLVCGHFHETAGLEDKIGSARVINPGPYGKLIKM